MLRLSIACRKRQPPLLAHACVQSNFYFFRGARITFGFTIPARQVSILCPIHQRAANHLVAGVVGALFASASGARVFKAEMRIAAGGNQRTFGAGAAGIGDGGDCASAGVVPLHFIYRITRRAHPMVDHAAIAFGIRHIYVAEGGTAACSNFS